MARPRGGDDPDREAAPERAVADKPIGRTAAVCPGLKSHDGDTCTDEADGGDAAHFVRPGARKHSSLRQPHTQRHAHTRRHRAHSNRPMRTELHHSDTTSNQLYGDH